MDGRSSRSVLAEPAARAWHSLDPAVVLADLQVDAEGLSSQEAARRLAEHGPNRLPQGRGRPAAIRLLLQFHNLLIYMLLAAGALAAAIGHVTDALVILAVVVINAVIGFIQEGRSERALEAIRGMIDPNASVIRDGRRVTVKAEARNLRVDEAVLTGESVPVDKAVAPVAADVPLGDRFSMAFSGTFVAAGQATGVAVETGMATELGRISLMIGAVERLATPLIRQMDQFARQVAVAVLGLSALVFGYAVLLRSYPLDQAFMAVVGLAVAAIPEGLPAVMTIALAVGVQRMAARNAIIRRLPAVETLGAGSAAAGVASR